jgi:dTMP kinase
MRSKTYPGFLIVFEGTDGTGKSTQLALLSSTLADLGQQVVSTCEPTEGTYGQQIRLLYTNREQMSLEEELALFIADRKEHVETLLLPALQEGKVVLCDRYYLSTMAYQGAAGLDPAEILKKNDFAPTPDLALLFYAPITTGVERITVNRGDSLNDFEKEEYLHKVALQFEQMQLPCITRIDARGTIESIQREVFHHVRQLLELA